MNFNGQRLLVVAAHLDDAELGCGGLLATCAAASEIWLLALSRNRRDAAGRELEVRDAGECRRAMAILGVPWERVIFPEREIAGQMFPEHRQIVLETLYETRDRVRPDAVFVPSANDLHQDHRTVAEAARKACKRCGLFGYEIVNSGRGFIPALYLELTEEALAKKIAAVDCYRSQQNATVTTADYFAPDVIRALARFRGVQAGFNHAEAFEVEQLLVKGA